MPTKKKRKVKRETAPEPTLREKLQPVVTGYRLGTMAFDEMMLADYGKTAKGRKDAARVARRARKAHARRLLGTGNDVTLKRLDFRALCAAAFANELTDRRTSDRVSRIAGRVLRLLEFDADSHVLVTGAVGNLSAGKITAADVRSLAASCLAQDTTPGLRAKGRRK